MKYSDLQRMAKILGPTYGGPSISYDKDTKEFVLYRWYDAPVDIEELSRGKTLLSLLRNVSKRRMK